LIFAHRWHKNIGFEEQRTTYLASLEWPARSLTEEDVSAFRRDGFLKMEQAFPAGTLEDILHTARRTHRIDDAGYALSWWWQNPFSALNLVRDFWYYSPASRYAAQVLNSTTVHMGNDFVSRVAHGDVGHCWHHDSYPHFAQATNSSPGLSIWIPLTPVRQSIHGGSMAVTNMSLLPPECGKNSNFKVPAHCWDLVDAAGVAYDFEVGDALLLGSQTFHRTVPVSDPKAERWTIAARLLSGQARYATPGSCNIHESWDEDQAYETGTSCQPRLYPSPDPAQMQTWSRFSTASTVTKSLFVRPLSQEAGVAWGWIKFTVIQGWLYRALWPEHKKCIFAKSHFVGVNQDPAAGRFR